MAAARVVVHPHGIRALLKSPEITRMLQDMGQSIADAAGDGHKVVAEKGPNRARVEVVTDTFDAMRREARDRTLTRAVGRGRR